MPIELIWGIVAVALLVIAVALTVLASSVVRLVREARVALASSQRLLWMLETELPPTVAQLRSLAGKMDGLADDLPPRLERLDALLDDSDETLAAVRASAEATEQVARVPLDAVERVRHVLRRGGPDR
jgi:uncharacterized protein YoxC